MGTWDVESTREQFLEVVGRNEILILRVLTNETGDVGTERDNPEIIDAGEIERHAGKFCSHALAFEWLRHFRVGISDAAGEVYQEIWKNYGVEESRGSLLKRRASSACSMTTAGSRWMASKYFFWKASPDSVGTNIFLAREMAPLVYSGVMGSLAARVSSMRTTNSEMLCSQANCEWSMTRRKSSPVLT